MSAFVSRCSSDLRYLWVSNALAAWIGVPVEEFVGRPIVDVIGADALDALRPYIDRVLKGERVEFEIQVPYARIGPRWMHAVYAPTYDGATANGWVAVIRDIDAQRRREDALRESEHAARRLAAIVESSDDAIASKDLNGIVMSWNRGAERMFGYSAGEIIGKSIRLIIPADRQSEEDHVLSRIRSGERVDHFETIRRRKDGTLVAISLSVSPIRDNAGRIVGASKIARDISEQQQTAARTTFLAEVGKTLATSLDYETTLKAVVNSAVPAVADWCAVDIQREDRIERLAVSHVDTRKVELAETVRRRYSDPQSPYSVESVIRTGRPAFVGDITDDMIVEAAHGDQERIAIVRTLDLRSYLCVPLIARGHTLGALTMATAESGRRYTERDLLFAENIASRAALAVDNARAYEEAQQANRLKDEFLATLSHELRTPLNAILGYVRIVQSGLVAGEKQVKAIDTVARNAASLTQIVEDVLDVSRIVAGKLRLDVQSVDLGKIVEHAVESAQPAASAKGVHVRTIVDPRADPVSGDPERLQQIVWNLVSNAVKFTPRGGHVDVRVERIESQVVVTVSDSGIGIEPEFLPHIFERFRQADAGTTRKHGGLGLGLAIARHLAELHGGTIEATSEGVGKGAAFRVSLPIRVVQPEAPSYTRSISRDAPTPRPYSVPNLRGVRIMAVDDDSDALTLLREVLEAAGAEVITADSAMSALQQVEAAHPDVLIADIGMPQMDGFELISRLRHAKAAAVRELPAAALTAYARSEDRAKALRTGFQMHLAKPIDPTELMAAVAALAKRNRPQ